MNKKNRIFIVSVLFVFIAQISAISQTYDDFYYTLKGKVYLNIVNNKYLVEFPNGVDENLFTQNNIVFDKVRTDTYVVDSDITTIQSIFGQVYFNAVYETVEGGFERKILNEIILKFKDDVDETAKNNLIGYYGLQETKSTRLYNKYSVNNSLQISKAVFESGLVDYCHPVFIGTPPTPYDGYIPNDTYFNKQFYLHNTGQVINDGHTGTINADIDAPEAWDLTKGDEDIVVAVIDDGVLDNHPDLPSIRQIRLPGSNIFWNYLSLELNNDPDDPSPVDRHNVDDNWVNHGNACAGIVGAEQDNNKGISGIAPLCKIMPVRIIYWGEGQSNEEYADAITFAYENEADVISCSWGWPDNYYIDEVVIAIEDAINGGSIVIFSVDDYTTNHAGNVNGGVGFPVNAGINGLIAVGASDRNDEQANYSPSNEFIDVVAPASKATPNAISGESSEVWSIDFPGNDGRNPWPFDWTPPPSFGEILPSSGTNNLAFTGRFSGTSASTPQVAGCVALALSVNPGLNINQINNLIKYKSDKVGGYNYNWNQAMLGHSKEFGYGRLNCYKMVQTASDILSPGVDLYTRDLEDDFGIEPNEAEVGTPMWHSPDIWVRNQNDGISNQETQNPISGITNYVYVRVTNIGETQSTGSELLKLHWAKAGTDLVWPENWNGDITDPLMGDLISQQNISPLQSGSETIVTFAWNDVPDPSLYEGINPEPWHFCLLSRIIATNDPMNTPEGVSVYLNTYNNNNIAWKNITIAGGKENTRNPGGVIQIGNIFGETTTFEIEFKVPQPCVGESILEVAEVKVTLDATTYQIWAAGGKQCSNITELKNKQLLITGDPALLQNLTFEGGQSSTMFVAFNFLTEHAETPKEIYKYLATQRRSSDQMVIGGELYIIHKPPRESDDVFDADAGADKNISKNESVLISAENIGEEAEYNWYNMADSLIYTGSNLNVTLDTTTTYKLEVLALSDGYKDYDEVTVNVKQYEIINIAPNPTNGQVTVEYDVEGVSSAYLLITKPFNPNTETIVLDVSQTQVTADFTGYETGVYGIILICNDQMVDQKLLSVQ